MSVRIVGAEVHHLDLPFRHPFRHAAADRVQSESVFIRCMTDQGQIGFGETLPRRYVTGEDQQATFDLLADRLLPRLLEMSFGSFEEVRSFLVDCDGRAPTEWVPPETPQIAAWCAVDLALLDTLGRAFEVALSRGVPDAAQPPAGTWPERLRYSLVLSSGGGRHTLETLLKARLYGLREVKVKVDRQSVAGVRLARRVLGQHAKVRVDCNMSWPLEEARAGMVEMSRQGVESFEQPLVADDVDGLTRLAAETGLVIVADESFHDAVSLERLIDARACASFNVRIAKCGGLMASLARCRRVLQAGLGLQIGCQVGETSHLSAAQMVLVRTLGAGVEHIEGCYGERLLLTDPVRPLLEFGRGGAPPLAPAGPGFGTAIDLAVLQRYSSRRRVVGAALPPPTKETP